MVRFIIGTCRSGKLVTSEPDLDGLCSPEDVFDSFSMLEAISIRELRVRGATSTFQHFRDKSLRVKELLSRDQDFSDLMQAISAKTSVDILHHARRLLRPEFKD